jgi:hypothetical protein
MSTIGDAERARRLAALTIARTTVALTEYDYDPVGALLNRFYVDGLLSETVP